MSFRIKQGDTAPPLRENVPDGDGRPLDLTGATVRFVMALGPGAVVVDQPATVTTAKAGTVEYAWQPGDTARPGRFNAEFQIAYSDGRRMTHPRSRYLRVTIAPKLAR